MSILLPKELLNIILDFDGRIKYKNGVYTNKIFKYDERYKIIQKIISKKKRILKNTEFNGRSFYFSFYFDSNINLGLAYDYNYSNNNEYEICYFNIMNGWHQIRTII
jgi:hypothetical protein